MEFSRQNTGVRSLSLLQGIFPTQGLNPGLLHLRWILYQLSHQGSPWILEWIAYPFSSGSSLPRNQTGGRQILYQLSYQGSPETLQGENKFIHSTWLLIKSAEMEVVPMICRHRSGAEKLRMWRWTVQTRPLLWKVSGSGADRHWVTRYKRTVGAEGGRVGWPGKAFLGRWPCSCDLNNEAGLALWWSGRDVFSGRSSSQQKGLHLRNRKTATG